MKFCLILLILLGEKHRGNIRNNTSCQVAHQGLALVMHCWLMLVLVRITETLRGAQELLYRVSSLPAPLSPGSHLGKLVLLQLEQFSFQIALHPQEESLTFPGGPVHPWLPAGQFLLVLVTVVPPKPCSAQQGLKELLFAAQGCL